MKQTILLMLSVVVGVLLSVSCSKEEPYAIYYTTINDTEISIENAGLNDIIVEHTYKKGKGVIVLSPEATSIVEKAFYDCEFITSVTIQDGVISIDNDAFKWCCNLTSITIPDSVTVIGDSAFEECRNLTNVTIPNSITAIGESTFRNCSNLMNINIPDSVTSIESSAFSGCSSLTSVTIPDSVTPIGTEVFRGCSSLQEFKGKFASEDGRCLIIDGTLNSFAPGGLVEYTIPDSVTTIGEYAFGGCSSLTSVTIGDSVTSIVEYAFSGCSSLTSVYCKPTTPPVALLYYNYWYAFGDYDLGRKIYVPMESVEAYKSAWGWKNYADDIVGYNF